MNHDDIAMLRESLRQGRCCASALVATALERSGESNDTLLRAMKGLCLGVHGGLVCGALTGAACMMNVLDSNANVRAVPLLVEWFIETVGPEYGGIDCEDILADAGADSAGLCRQIVEMTFRHAMELLEKDGEASA